MGQGTQAGDGFPALEPVGPATGFNTLVQADRIADLALSMALEFTRARRGFLILLNEQGRTRYCFGRDTEGRTGESRPPDTVMRVMAAVRRSRRPLTGQGAPGTRPHVCVPLMTGPEMVGVLYLERPDDAASFQAREERLAELAAGQLAISLTARVLYEQMTEKRKQVELIDRVSQAVASPGDLEEVLAQVAESAREALGAQGGALLLRDEDAALQVRHRHSIREDLLQVPAVSAGARLVREVLESGAAGTSPCRSSGGGAPFSAVAVPVKQVLRERRVFNERRRSAYSVPFAKTLGVLYLENHDRPREFSDDDQLVLQVFADHVTNAVSSDTLYRQASTDKLTGLASRRYLDLRLEAEVEFAETNTCPLSVVMLDIDDFKVLNDTYGHQAGDDVLRQIGQVLRDSVRRFDICGRYGGEEFVLGLPETGPEGAQVVAENVRRNIAAARFLDVRRPVPVTVSLGVATFPSPAADLPSLLGAADGAMYEAKRGGKNRFAVAGQQQGGQR